MTGKIFINYRRGDDPGFTGRLFDRLQEAFEPERLFMDVDNIDPGLDFVKVLKEQVAQCDVLISIIGRNWIDASDENGARRLDNPTDFVRIEIKDKLLNCITVDSKPRTSTAHTNTVTIKATTTKGKPHSA